MWYNKSKTCYYFLIVSLSVLRIESKKIMGDPLITVISPNLEVGTRPHYDLATDSLYFVDVPTSNVYKFDLNTKKVLQCNVGKEPIGFMFPIEGSNTTFIASLGLRLAFVEWDGESSTAKQVLSAIEVPGPGRFNGGKIDPWGRLWAGTMGPNDNDGSVIPGMGSLYSFSKGVLKKHEDKIGISNGLAWDIKNEKMYYIDTLVTKVFQYDFNVTTGDISNKKEVFDFKSNDIKGAPDGLTIDAENKLWVAAINGSSIVRFDPNDGSVLQKIVLPAEQVTAVTFGDKNLEQLFVTTARMADANGTIPADPAGRTFSVKNVGIRGQYDVRYKP